MRRIAGRLRDTVLAIFVPVFVLFIVGLLTGSEDLGTRELDALIVVWILGLAWVWWPWRDRGEPR